MNRLLLVLLLAPFTLAAQSALNDLDGDGCVGATDILVILGQYGECQDTITAFACGDSVLFNNYWYETVLIGDQCWFAENLRTVQYSNGDTIPAVIYQDPWIIGNGIWVNQLSGARCHYGNNNPNNLDESIVELWGWLYNWYAVDDARGLCPTGWHVPTDGEWTNLENYMTSQGFGPDIPTALKSTTGWSNSNGTDDFEFSALPGGFRNANNGLFIAGGTYAGWWTSFSPDPFTNAYQWYRSMEGSPYLNRSTKQVTAGLSVRCLKDPE